MNIIVTYSSIAVKLIMIFYSKNKFKIKNYYNNNNTMFVRLYHSRIEFKLEILVILLELCH